MSRKRGPLGKRHARAPYVTPRGRRAEREHPPDVDPDEWARLEAMTPEQRIAHLRDTTPRPPRNV